jgi:hypothetical protein
MKCKLDQPKGRLSTIVRSPVVNLSVLLGLIFIATPSQAAITINGVSGVSIPYSIPANPTGASTPVATAGVTLYAGTAGTLPTSGLDPNSTYNTCANPASGTGLFACNDARIHPALNLSIGFTSSVTTGNTLMTISPLSGATNGIVPSGFVPVAASPNNPTGVTATWGAICQAMITAQIQGIDQNCMPTGSPPTAVTATLNIGVSVDGATFSGGDGLQITLIVSGSIGQTIGTTDVSTTTTCANTNGSPPGICQFEAFPGDGKVVMRYLTLGSGANTGGRSFQKLRLLWVQADGNADHTVFGQINSTSQHQDLPFAGAGQSSLSSDRVFGFTNDVTYTFKAAVIDDVGNVGYYSDSDTPATTGDAESNDADCSNAVDFPAPYACHVTTPDQVLGVLANEFNCFIATAAYGSGMAPQVQLFREFRNEYLLPNYYGKQFVKAYYRNSPYYANMIAESPILRAISRGVLWPFAGVAWLYIHLGPVVATTFLVFLIFAVFILSRFAPQLQALRTGPKIGRRGPRD